MKKLVLLFILFLCIASESSSVSNKPYKITTETERYTYTYDGSGNILSTIIEYSTKSNWETVFRFRYEYDSHNHMTAEYREYSDGHLMHPSFELSQNYPNPFNQGTRINYFVFREGHLKLSVYDLLGCKVEDLLDEYKPAGSYFLNYSAKDLSSGVYIYRLESNGYSFSKKFILLK